MNVAILPGFRVLVNATWKLPGPANTVQHNSVMAARIT
jgi:hypothetical protein